MIVDYNNSLHTWPKYRDKVPNLIVLPESSHKWQVINYFLIGKFCKNKYLLLYWQEMISFESYCKGVVKLLYCLSPPARFSFLP